MNTFSLVLYTEEFFVNKAIKQQQYAGCVTTPTPKSEKAKLRIKIYEGVRKEDVFTKVKMTKKFKTAASTEPRELKPRRK